MPNYIDYDVICSAKLVSQAIADDVNKYCDGKKLIDIGCADGSMGELLKCAEYVGVDPFSESADVIKMDGLEYLQKLEDKSVDVILCKFAVHFFEMDAFQATCKQKLKENGAALVYSISGRDSQLFENEAFNQVFLNNFHDEVPSYILKVDLPMTREKLSAHLTNRAWSNMTHLSTEEIESANNLIPDA